MDTVMAESVELLQTLIRNACVNKGIPESGFETKNADVLEAYLGGVAAVERYEKIAGRASLVARIEGSDPSAPGLVLMGHTDVVPANENGWSKAAPFSGELIGDEVWGRGAVDMLNVTATMAVAFKRLAQRGFTPRGDLIYFAVADEEAAGIQGAKYVTEEHRDAVQADFVVTEFGGMRLPIGDGVRMPVMVGEKGTFWCTVTTRGTPGHASMPFASDNALVKGAEIVRRLAAYQPETQIHDIWRRFVEDMAFPPEMAAAFLDPIALEQTIAALPVELGRVVHACTHMTVAPTVMHAGVKGNVIPDSLELKVDIRTLPGMVSEDVRRTLEDLIGDLGTVEEILDSDMPSTASKMDTPLWDSLQRVTASLVPEARTVPFLMTAATDARYFREIGATAYGYGLFSDRIPYNEFGRMFHGDDERVDLESLRLAEALWERLAEDLLG